MHPVNCQFVGSDAKLFRDISQFVSWYMPICLVIKPICLFQVPIRKQHGWCCQCLCTTEGFAGKELILNINFSTKILNKKKINKILKFLFQINQILIWDFNEVEIFHSDKFILSISPVIFSEYNWHLGFFFRIYLASWFFF